MSIADPIREKGRELHSLARKLSEHLGGRDHREWSDAEIQGMMQDLHRALGEIEDHLDMEGDDEETPSQARPDVASTAGDIPEAPAEADAPPSEGEPLSEGTLSAPAAETRGVTDFLRPPEPPPTLRRRATELASSFSFGSVPGAGDRADSDDSGSSESAHASTLEDFFGRVGDSLITAQRQLDARARSQLVAGGDPELATLYRIPKVSAELKFALEEVGKGGINLLIYRQGTEASTLNQQTVQFDIAAVPAPPETVAAVRRQAPHLDWVLDTPTRERIREALDNLPGGGSQPILASQSLLLAHLDRTLVVRDPRHEDGFFLAFANRDEDHHVGAWYLDLEPPSLTPLVRFELRPKPGENPKPLRDLVAALGERQADLLQGF